MTSSNGDIFRVTGPLCEEFTNSPQKGQWRGAYMFFVICAWMNFWISNREAGDLRRHRAKYDVTVIRRYQVSKKYWKATLNWSDDFSITQHHQNILMSSFEDFVLTMSFTWNSDASEAFYCVINYPSPATTKMKMKYNTQKFFFVWNISS